MRFKRRRWLHYSLVSVAIAGSLVSLFALFVLGSPRGLFPSTCFPLFAFFSRQGRAPTVPNGNSE
jgi:hypothetical protein